MVLTEQNIPPLTLSIVASIEDTFMYLFSVDPIITTNIDMCCLELLTSRLNLKLDHVGQ